MSGLTPAPGRGKHPKPKVLQAERTTRDAKSPRWRFLGTADVQPLRIVLAPGQRYFLENPGSLVQHIGYHVSTVDYKEMSLTADHPTLVYPRDASVLDLRPLRVAVLPVRRFLTSDEVNGIQTRNPLAEPASARDRVALAVLLNSIPVQYWIRMHLGDEGIQPGHVVYCVCA